MTSLLATSQPTPVTGPRTLSRNPAFWLVAGTTATMLAASSAPSPLYPVLQAEFGFSTIMLTTIFAVYVLALLLACSPSAGCPTTSAAGRSWPSPW